MCFDFAELLLQVEVKTFGLARCGAVADGDQLHFMLDAQCGDDGGGFSGLTGVRVHGVGGDQLAGSIDYRHFDPGTQARIQPHGGAHTGRGRHQQVMHVTGKDVDRFVFRAFAHRAHQFGFQMQQHLDTPGPVDHRFAPGVRRSIIQAQIQVADDDLLRLAFAWGFFKLRIGIQRQLQYAFVTATEHGQRTVRWHLGNGFMMIEIVAELGAGFFLAFHYFGHQVRMFPQVVTDLGQ